MDENEPPIKILSNNKTREKVILGGKFCIMAVRINPNAEFGIRDEMHTIHKLFMNSSTLGLCRDTLCDAVLKGEVYWFDKTLEKKKRGTNHYFDVFIRKIITELFCYGYATYCLMKKKSTARNKHGPIEKHFYPYVADGREYRIELDTKHWKWELVTDSTYPEYKMHGMELLIDTEPIRTDSRRYTIDSCVVRCASLILQVDELVNNIHLRDMYNSKPSCFTSITPRVTANDGRDTQWFIDTNMQSIPNRATPLHPTINTFNNDVESRMSLMEGVHLTTQKNRQYNKTDIDSADIPYRIQNPLDAQQPLNPLDHREYFVTDGHVPEKMMTLQPGDDVMSFRTTITHRIMQICGVPPQATGEEFSGNSERKPSTNMIQQQSLQRYQRKVCKYQCYINEVLRNISTILDPSGKEVLQLDIPLDSHTLLSLEGVLKEEALTDYIECVHGVAKHKIDQEALRQRKETINLEQAMERRATSNGAVTKRIKPPKTDMDKEASKNPRKQHKEHKNGVRREKKLSKNKRHKPKQTEMQKLATSRAQADSYK